MSSLRDHEITLSESDQGELLAGVEESVDRLTRLVDNLLDSSRIAAGAVVTRLEPVGYDEVAALALTGVDGGHRATLSPRPMPVVVRSSERWKGTNRS